MGVRRHPELVPGMVFGSLRVLGVVREPGRGIVAVRCRCACGGESTPSPHNLYRGASTRCNPCSKLAAAASNRARSGYDRVVGDPHLRATWLGRICAAVDRCTNPRNPAWANYGGRGIAVHGPWLRDRRLFLRYITTLDGWTNVTLSLDRIDNERGYEPGNLRMATQSEQMRNTRANRGGGHEADCAWCGRRFLRAVWRRRYCGKPCAGRASHLRPGERGPSGQVRVEQRTDRP